MSIARDWRLRAVAAALLGVITFAASRAAAAPPMRLTVRSVESAASKAATDGTLDAYFAELGAALARELDGGATKASIRFAAGEHGRAALLQWRLLEKIGPEGRKDPALAETLAWLLADQDALAMLFGSGEPAGGRWREAVGVLGRCARDGTHREGLPLRVSVATALVFAEPVRAMADGSEIDPVARVDSFLEWDTRGELFPSFRELSPWELRFVVGSWSTDADLAWARANIKPDLRRRDKVGEAAHMLAYNLTNKNGVSVQEGKRFYDDKPMTLAVMLEYGGVCGAISRFGSSMSQAFGVPAMPVGQPGHCAFLWQKEPRAWTIGNDISGWSESAQHDGVFLPWGREAWFVRLMQDAQADRAGLVAAEALLGAAELGGEASWGTFASEACRSAPQHYGAWSMRLSAARGAKTGKGARDAGKDLPKELAAAFARHPVAYARLANMLPTGPAPATDAEEVRRARALAATIAGFARAGADAGLSSWALRTVLEESARRLSGAQDAGAALAFVRGEPAPAGAPKSDALGKVVGLAFEATDALDVAPQGSAHDAWKGALDRAVRGTAGLAEERDAGLRAIERRVAGLAGQSRLDDARWLADRLVEAVKAAKSAGRAVSELEPRATALRQGLG